MEVHYRLHEVPGHLTWSTVAQGRSQEHGISEASMEVLFAETPLFPTSSMRSYQTHPRPGKSP